MSGAPHDTLQRRLVLRKDNLKFDAAHMTVGPAGSKERLHGHSYQVSLELELGAVAHPNFLNLTDLRHATEAVCAAWNQHFLLPTRCPELEMLSQDAEETVFLLCGKRYAMPTEDVKALPIENAIIEHLSVCFASDLWRELHTRQLPLDSVAALSVCLEESVGQGGATRLARPSLDALLDPGE